MASFSKHDEAGRIESPIKPTHIDEHGALAMVDVSAKSTTTRIACAVASVCMNTATERALRDATLAKGDAFVAAQLAGILAAKQTATLIPLAHPIPLASVTVTFDWVEQGVLQITAVAKTSAQTGVEMEAMAAVSVAALTIYDMVKSLERGVTIASIRLLEKSGGVRGDWQATE